MKCLSRLSSRTKLLALACALVLPASVAPADTIYTAVKNAAPFPRKGVTIVKIDKTDDGEVLRYTTPSGDSASKKMDDIVQIEADGEPIFSQAEAEFAKNDLAAAGTDYRKAISLTQKDWVKHRADVRLLFISSKTGDFVGAVAGFVELAKKDPSGAAAHKPAIPDKSPLLTNAITAVISAMGGTSSETKKAVYPFLIELYNKNGQPEKASEYVTLLQKLGPSPNANPTAPGVAQAVTSDQMDAKAAEAETALTVANKAFAGRDYAKTIEAINAHSAAFIAPDQQAKALYLIAQSKAAMATTPEAMEDAAMAYMRVVAHFKSMPDPAAEALYQTGAIEERLKKINEAKAIYDQVITEYKDTNAAKEAQAAKAKLN